MRIHGHASNLNALVAEGQLVRRKLEPLAEECLPNLAKRRLGETPGEGGATFSKMHIIDG